MPAVKFKNNINFASQNVPENPDTQRKMKASNFLGGASRDISVHRKSVEFCKSKIIKLYLNVI